VVHVPDEVNVRAIRKRLTLTVSSLPIASASRRTR